MPIPQDQNLAGTRSRYLSSENCLWFTISKELCFKDIVFGVIYLPPEGSPHSSIDLFDKLKMILYNTA